MLILIVYTKTHIRTRNASYKEICIDDVVRHRFYISESGVIYDAKYDRELKGHINKGYLRVTLYNNDKTQKSYYIHVLVLCTYLIDRRESLFVNHIDGNKTNNYLFNLEWVSHRENMRHAIESGLIKNKRMMTESEVKEICSMLEDGWKAKDISCKMNINTQTIYGIRSGLNWVDISKNYTFPKRDKYNNLDINIVESVCSDIARGVSLSTIATKYNIKYPTVSSIKNKKSWVSVSNRYF